MIKLTINIKRTENNGTKGHIEAEGIENLMDHIRVAAILEGAAQEIRAHVRANYDVSEYSTPENAEITPIRFTPPFSAN